MINLFICWNRVLAQEPFLYHYSTKDGLGSREVHHVFQDSQGYMWFSTDGGITRYNANEFKNFTTYNGLPDNTVFEVMEDKSGRLWFRTFTGGIGYILNDSVVSVTANKMILELQGNGILQSFAMDEKGSIWLGRTATDGCFYIKVDPPYNGQSVSKITSKNVKNNGIDALIIGERIVFADNRSFVATPSAPTIPYVLFIRKANTVLLSDTFSSDKTSALVKLFLYGDEVIHGSGFFLRKYNLNTGKKTVKALDGSVITWLKDNEKIILGYRNIGVTEYESFKMPLKTNYLKNLSITCIKKDRDDGYWFATLENGIYYCPDKNYVRQKLYKAEKEGTEISSFIKMNDSLLLVGTKSGNIYSIEKCNGIIQEKLVYSNAADGAITKLIKLSNMQLLAMNSSILTSCLFRTQPAFKFEKKITRYKQMVKTGRFYTGFNVKDVNLCDTTNFEKVKTYEFPERINALVYDNKKNIIYVGGVNGLFELDPEREYIKKTGPECRIERMLYNNGYLFMATKSNGLIVKKDNRYDTITVENGLSSNICRKLFFNQNELWVITYSGLSRLKYNGNKNYTIKNYFYSDNALSENIEALEFNDSSFVFFEANNLYFFPLEQGKKEEIPFELKSILVNGRPVNVSDRIVLKYDENNIQIKFPALFFKNNGTVAYRYKFTGDTNWVYTNKSDLSFPSLSPGSYLLSVQARNNNGNWVESRTGLSLEIENPFWLKWWFIVIISALTLVLITWIVYYKYKQALASELEKNETLKKLYYLEIKAVKAQMNPHFIANCLTAIQELIYSGNIDKAGQYLAKFSFFLRRVLDHSDKTYISLKDELETVDLNIELEQLRFKESFEFRVNLHPEIDPKDIMIPSLITQPLIENAIWHGLLPLKDRKPGLTVNIYLKNSSVFIEIEDNGVGRKTDGIENGKKSRGSKLVKDKLESIARLTESSNYKLNVVDLKDENDQPAGTKIIIQLDNSAESIA